MAHGQCLDLVSQFAIQQSQDAFFVVFQFGEVNKVSVEIDERAKVAARTWSRQVQHCSRPETLDSWARLATDRQSLVGKIVNALGLDARG